MNHFYALLNRMKYINRWGLMRNTRAENLSEHSLETAVIAHALAIIGNKRFNKNYDCDRIAVLAMYHDCSEILTGDLPTPVKYFNPSIKTAYHNVEDYARNKLISYLPDDIKNEYIDIFIPNDNQLDMWKIVKAADKISAIIKCIEEKNAGNTEFNKAYFTLMNTVKEMHMPEVELFLEEFLPSYELTLDEQE